ncbi:hypothetical protein [Komagataeibacter nataicola]|uniref:hypothetical protein n=1 Tax=Komagataeibacter nataicola TaxID=265960 RepID=UPI001428D869|nr:hypothetical protein [Komagataeibacter nataicola]WNM08417.1 hypothetical protein RI056_16390 [Komagataeibacter nataicola]GBR22962.1 hypothetical protein AA0616_2407 [Komagataeibacter nataicola NRIC 0616]
MTHKIRIAGDLTETVELIEQNRYRVFLRRNGEIVAMQAAVWQRLVDSGRVLEVGNG